MQKPRILVIGGACAEITVQIPIIPMAGQRIMADGSVTYPGGAGTLTSAALSRLGADCLLSSKVGSDLNGKELKEYFDAENIDSRFVTVTRDCDTAMELSLEDGISRPRRIICGGAISNLSEEDIEEAFISYPDAVILHSDIPAELSEVAASLAREKSIPLFVMSASGKAFISGVLGYGCEVLSVNEDEVFSLTGMLPSDEESCMKACMEFTRMTGAKHTVLRLGERGYFLYDGMYYSFVPSYDIENLAGADSDNAFAASFVYEYLRSEGDTKRAAELAAIVSAIYITKGGGLASYPSADDVRRFIKQNELDFDFDLYGGDDN